MNAPASTDMTTSTALLGNAIGAKQMRDVKDSAYAAMAGRSLRRVDPADWPVLPKGRPA